MLDASSLPVTCAVKQRSLIQCFACLKEIINHAHLTEDEKYLWLWLFANQSASNPPFSCSYSYEQISTAVHKSSQKIHRVLTRLRTMGGLIANIPVHYGKLTKEMMQTEYNIMLTLPPNTASSR
ncbi:MAG: hypothetical protein JSS07_02990 [Proteobacteria bacterium]|nr:hypothetical protein [Pseudomonadota bacterium]